MKMKRGSDAGSASVTIGRAGFSEWRAVGGGAALQFALPGSRGRVIVVTRYAVLYDSLVDGNEVYAPAGSFVFFAGVAGDTFRVSENPAVSTAPAAVRSGANAGRPSTP